VGCKNPINHFGPKRLYLNLWSFRPRSVKYRKAVLCKRASFHKTTVYLKGSGIPEPVFDPSERAPSLRIPSTTICVCTRLLECLRDASAIGCCLLKVLKNEYLFAKEPHPRRILSNSTLWVYPTTRSAQGYYGPWLLPPTCAQVKEGYLFAKEPHPIRIPTTGRARGYQHPWLLWPQQKSPIS